MNNGKPPASHPPPLSHLPPQWPQLWGKQLVFGNFHVPESQRIERDETSQAVHPLSVCGFPPTCRAMAPLAAPCLLYLEVSSASRPHFSNLPFLVPPSQALGLTFPPPALSLPRAPVLSSISHCWFLLTGVGQWVVLHLPPKTPMKKPTQESRLQWALGHSSMIFSALWKLPTLSILQKLLRFPKSSRGLPEASQRNCQCFQEQGWKIPLGTCVWMGPLCVCLRGRLCVCVCVWKNYSEWNKTCSYQA